jgi:hypothetical protein
MISSVEVEDKELLCRYVFSRSNTLPPPDNYPDEISVYRVDHLQDEQIWDIGHRFVGNERNPPIPAYARGDFNCASVKRISKTDNENDYLYLEIETSPHERHANIRNVKLVDKGLKKVLALKLANLTTLKINSWPLSLTSIKPRLRFL